LFGLVGIDLPAGPTEILVIADESADPALVATDLLGQAEHGPDSPAWLITTSAKLGREVIAEIERQLLTLPTAAIASAAWSRWGEVAVVRDDDAAIALSDQYAPEHLEVLTKRNDYYLDHLKNYGSLFVGEESTVAYGDKESAPITPCRRARSALHRWLMGREVPEDRHVSAPDAGSEREHCSDHGADVCQ
jgi:sulfopropanediol 3-dehydrogenase